MSGLVNKRRGNVANVIKIVNALAFRVFSSGQGAKTAGQDVSSSIHNTINEINSEIGSLLGTGSEDGHDQGLQQETEATETFSMHQKVARSIKEDQSSINEVKIMNSLASAARREHLLTHVGASGEARMVDVTTKDPTHRTATAIATVILSPEAFQLVADNEISKGDVLTVAKLAGIMGAKHTSSLIPLCHPLLLTHSDVALKLDHEQYAIRIEATAMTVGQTGVEMEALTGAAISALTVYDMCKAVDKGIEITGLRLLSKTGGKRGDWSAHQGGNASKEQSEEHD